MVSLEHIRAAGRCLSGHAHRTPVFRSRMFDERTGRSVVFKGEHLQRAGSFKFRGAFNALSRLSGDERAGGVLTYSSGNHAQALALAASELGVRATIIMPSDAPEVKAAATRGYGGEVISYDREETTREELGAQISRERGLPIIPPYDHPDVVAGQGTVALEFLEQVSDLDTILIPCGGGGLLSGCAVAIKNLAPHVRVIGVEPAAADDATRSFMTRTLHTVHNPVTIADGARTPSLGAVTFPLVLEYVDDMVTVTEDAIVEALAFLWGRMKLVVEPTGTLGAAAMLTRADAIPGERIGVVISGGNADITLVSRLISEMARD
jgi:threo-3-hydroxy-L-aspartate ammonia-lyase